MDTFINGFDWAGIVQNVVVAIIILLVTWLVAKLVTKAFAVLVGKVHFLQRYGEDGTSLGESLGTIASLLVWLFGLMAVLQLFSLDGVLQPINSLLAGIMGFLPNLIGAGVVFVFGLIVAKIVRQIVETSLSAMPLERYLGGARGEREGRAPEHVEAAPPSAADRGATRVRPEGGGNSARIASTLGTVVYALILILFAIVALQILGIEAISIPAQAMLAAFLAAVPNIVGAGIVLAVGVLVGRFVGGLLADVLDGFGADRALREMQILPEGQSATPGITKVAQVAIVLFFAVMAANLLGFPEITAFLGEVLSLGGRILLGGAIIAVGFYVANLLVKLLGRGTGTEIVRYVTIVLFAAMGLKSMGIADSIIELAFGAIVVGAAAAAALAFGLGGRDVAGRTLEELRRRSDKV